LKSIGDWRAVFDALGDAVFVLDAETAVIRDANQRMSEMYGYALDEVVGMTWGDAGGDLSPNNADDANRHIMEAARAGSGLFEWPAKHKKGGSFWVEVSVRVALTESGNFIVATTRDITDRKVAQQELTATKEYLSIVFNSIHDAVFVHDIEGKVLDVNDTMCEMYQFTRDEAIGLSIIPDYTAPEDRPDFPAIWKRVVAGEVGFFECKGRRPKDGFEFEVDVFLTRLPLPGNDYILATVRNITDRKQAERELTATRDYLNTVFNNIHDALFVHDVEGRVLDVNNRMCEMYQCSRDEAVGLSVIPDYALPEGHPDYPVVWKNAAAGENAAFECTARRPGDGYEFDVEVILSKLPLPGRDCVLACVRDISARKRAEQELAVTKDYLKTIFNNIHDGVFVHDVEGKVLDVNDKLLDLYRFSTREEAIGLSIMADYTTPEGRPDFPGIWKKIIAGEDGFFECKGRRPKDGHTFDAEVFLTRLPLPGTESILATIRDISARKRAEEGLQTQKQKFQALSEGSPVGMAVVDGSDRFTFKYMNPKFRNLFGCDMQKVPDVDTWLTRLYPEPVARRGAGAKWLDILKAMGPGMDRSYVRKLSGKAGSRKYIEFVPVQLQVDEILMACWDITKTKEAERRIRERNLVLGVLNDIMASVTHSLELSEILEPLRAVLAEKLRISAGGIFFPREGDGQIETRMSWGVPPSLRENFGALALQCRKDGQVLHESDIVLVRHKADGSETKAGAGLKISGFRSYLCISMRAKGEMEGMIFLVDKKRDTFSDDQIAFYKTLGQQVGIATQNARLFEEVRQSHAEMRALSLRLVRAQEDELRYVARELHDEIGQLLTGLRLAIEMTLQSTEEPVASLLEAESLANALTGLVRELSRKLRPSMLDDLGLFPTLRWLFGRFSTHAGIQVIFEHTQSDTRRFSHEAETAVYRIVQEALTNVARHAKVNWATVRLWSHESTLGIQVEDHGVGFDFPSATKAGETNGLNIMRERVMLLGGQFSVEASPGSGTRLTAELPAEMEDSDA
jgi:PAS domain S-box-containing protein